MFHNMPQAILDRMRELEQIDVLDRAGGTARMKRLRQIPPEVGRFIALLAAAAPDGRCIEIGTSAGYSTLWLALSCRAKGRKVTTFEVQDEKAKLARTTFDVAGVTDVVQLVHGDALNHLPACNEIGFCFLDAEKEVYDRCYEAVVPHLVPGGLILFTFGVLGGGACVVRIDSAIIAPATVTVESNRTVVAHLEGGIIAEVLVHEGDKVTGGQSLFRLSDIAPRANMT